MGRYHPGAGTALSCTYVSSMKHVKWKQQLNYKLFGKEPGSSYRPFLDILRVIATLFVVAIHTVSYAASLTERASASYQVLTLFVFTFVSCNLLFVMISGALLLPVQHESAGAFYRKRLLKVAVPLVVYYILYVCAKNGVIATLSPAKLPGLFVRMLSGAPVEAPHFWLIYVILFLYLITPLLRWFLGHIPDAVCRGLIIAIFVTNAVSCYLPLLGIALPLMDRVVGTYAGVYVLGYYLSKENIRRQNAFFLAAGVLSYLFTACLIFGTSNYENYIYGNAPTMMFYAAGLFVLVKDLAQRNPRSLPADGTFRAPGWLFVRLVSRYSYSVLLIHWGVLHVLVKQILRVNVLGGGIWGGCFAMFALTFLFSLLGAILLDNTLFWAIDCIGRKRKR